MFMLVTLFTKNFQVIDIIIFTVPVFMVNNNVILTTTTVANFSISFISNPFLIRRCTTTPVIVVFYPFGYTPFLTYRLLYLVLSHCLLISFLQSVQYFCLLLVGRYSFSQTLHTFGLLVTFLVKTIIPFHIFSPPYK